MTSLNTERVRVLSTLVTAVALLSACGGGGGNAAVAPPPPGPPPSVERTLSPTLADPNAEQVNSPDVVINPSPSVAAKGKLFVFLPGSEGAATNYRLILRSGAARGYHTIGLDYENNDVVGVVCLASSDPNCFWDVRREVITGQNVSNDVSVNNANSIVTRVAKALSYLAANSADEGWGQFLNADGSVDWSKVVVGGHSQGGGHAGVMAKLFALSRACYFASPADTTAPQVPASWMSLPGQTPGSAQYGIVHVSDPLVPLTDLQVIWPTLGMPGSPTSVDGQSAPYGGAHQLTTDVTPVNGAGSFSPYHGVTVYDPDVPLQGGVPVFDAVWGYMCFP